MVSLSARQHYYYLLNLDLFFCNLLAIQPISYLELCELSIFWNKRRKIGARVHFEAVNY